MPIATAFLTVYNEQRRIRRAVDSLLRQTLRDIEVLVVDDGSTDRTPAILAAIDDRRLRVLRRERMGRAAALALATTEARGQYLANLDADDEAFPRRLERQVAFLEAHPEVGWVGSAVDRDDRQRGEHVVRTYPQSDAAIRRQAARCIPYCHSAVMFRAELMRQGINYDRQQPFLIDFEFFIRVANRYEVANLDEVLVTRRVRSESFFQSRFSTTRQNPRLASLCTRAIREFHLPFPYYVYPVLRLGYPFMPLALKRLVRSRTGLVETHTEP